MRGDRTFCVCKYKTTLLTYLTYTFTCITVLRYAETRKNNIYAPYYCTNILARNNSNNRLLSLHGYYRRKPHAFFFFPLSLSLSHPLSFFLFFSFAPSVYLHRHRDVCIIRTHKGEYYHGQDRLNVVFVSNFNVRARAARVFPELCVYRPLPAPSLRRPSLIQGDIGDII